MKKCLEFTDFKFIGKCTHQVTSTYLTLLNLLFFISFTSASPNSLNFELFTFPPITFEIIWCPKHIPNTGISSFKRLNVED